MIGTTLQNRYRLDAELGRGGMGVVYRAHDTLLDRDVAVKVLSAAVLGSEGRARLLREARAAAQLNHPNIVSIHDAGEVDGVPFIVMELVEGESLHSRRPTDLDEILGIARQMCAALEHAHAHGIIHRDLKPENVTLAPIPSPSQGEGEGVRVKLMDFGLARSAAARRSSGGALVGTVFYLAPEQALGQAVDGRADLYALGVMLYELTTGRLPFAGNDPLAVVSQHIHSPVAPPRTLRPDLPPALEAIILRLLAKNPADRYVSAREVANTLAEVAEGHPSRSAVPARHNLPIQLTSFIGREKEMADIKRLLPDRHLLTLTGSGGTGKTRLALQVAVDLLEAFSDGVWLVELASLTDPDLVPQTVAAVLGVREEPSYPVTKALVDYLRSKSLLLILDNCEHLLDACAQMAEALLRACPNVKILATGREALGIAGETTFRVPSLSLPDIRRMPAVEDLTQYESVRLFVDRAVAVRPEFRMTDANAAAIAHVCHRLDGVPLAIELAAARVRAMTAEQIAARLDDRFRLLTGGSRTALPRQQTLRALIDWSWDLLSDVERVLLRRLAVFVGGWMLEAAEVVCAQQDEGGGLSASREVQLSIGLQPFDILELLTHLVGKSLVVMEEQGQETRYRLPETIRQYARDKLLEAGESEWVRARHLNFFLELSAEAEPRLRTADQLMWLARLETEHDNLRAALKWALGSGDGEAGLCLAGNLSRFWYLRGYWNEGREWLKLMLSQSGKDTALPKPVARARARALYGAGWLADEDGSEIPLYTESLALCRQIGDKWGEAFSLRGLVAGASNWGSPEHILPRLQESLALFRELREPWGIALVDFNLGWLALGQDDQLQAEATWEDGLRLFRQSGDRWGIAVSLNALGYVARLRGNYPRATALTEESLKLFHELGDKAGIAVSFIRLGNVAFRRGDYAEATALLEKSLALQRERGDQQGVANSLNLLGLVACYQGDYRRAVALLEESLALARESGNQYFIPYALSYLALVAHYQNDIEHAAALWQESLLLHREQEDKEGVPYSLYGLGLAAQHQGDYALAAERLDESLTLYRTAGDKRYIAAVLHSLGQLAQTQGDPTRAAIHFKESLILRKKMGDRQGIAESLEGWAGMAVAQGLPDSAARLFGAAAGIREAIGAPLPPVERAEYNRSVAAARAQLGEAAFAAVLAEGRAMALEQAIAYALEQTAS